MFFVFGGRGRPVSGVEGMVGSEPGVTEKQTSLQLNKILLVFSFKPYFKFVSTQLIFFISSIINCSILTDLKKS